jgi:hypothetical protein
MKLDLPEVSGKVVVHCQDPTWQYTCVFFERGAVLFEASPAGPQAKRKFPTLEPDPNLRWLATVDAYGHVTAAGASRESHRLLSVTNIYPNREEPETHMLCRGWDLWTDVVGLENLGTKWCWKTLRGRRSAFGMACGALPVFKTYPSHPLGVDLGKLGPQDRTLESLPLQSGNAAHVLVWSQKNTTLRLHKVRLWPSREWHLLEERTLPTGWEIIDIHPTLSGAILRNSENGKHSSHRKGHPDGFQFSADRSWSWNRLSLLPIVNTEDHLRFYDWRGHRISIETRNGSPDVYT